MPVNLNELVLFANKYLNISKVKDYCPNGLQVEGRPIINKIVGGVTASQALIDEAINQKADAILVHHGYFWKGEPPVITGIKQRRLKALLENDISLIAYHLPLDMHPTVGNNVLLAKQLKLELMGSLDPSSSTSVGLVGKLLEPTTAHNFEERVSQELNRECLHIGDPDKVIETIGFCTGAAQGMIDQAVALGLDAYLSGEISESTVHTANETGVNYFSAGHHATERGGVKALGALLAEEFEIEFKFLDIPNPV